MVRQKREKDINSQNANPAVNHSNQYIGVTAAKGFLAAGIKAGIKKSDNFDFGCLYSIKDAAVAAAFTTNRFAAAPVRISQEVIKKSKLCRFILVNSGVANACTGEQGLKSCRLIIEKAAHEFGVSEDKIHLSSTGKIGVQLPLEKILKNIGLLKSSLTINSDNKFVNAIMTTDTFEKKYDTSFKLGNKTVFIGGCSKGAGMINPNMATMLCYITTDADIVPELLQAALDLAVKKSFNSITVDGDMSTNDSVFVLANGMAENKIIDSLDSDYFEKFQEKLTQVCVELAKNIVRDGEGATKFIQIKVENAGTLEKGKVIADLIANSCLVKTAFFGCDPNWGRIISSVGSAPFDFDPDKVKLFLNNTIIFEKSAEAEYDIEKVRKIMKNKEIHITVDMGISPVEPVIVWTTDLSYDYVKINAEYST